MALDQKGDSDQPSLEQDAAMGAAIIGWVVSSLACMTYPFTRVEFGKEYFQFQAILGIVILWFYSGETSPHDVTPCLMLTGAFFLALIVHRFRYFVYGVGADQKSRYNGLPMACLGDGGVSEDTAKLFVEPFVVSGVALLILDLWSPSLGKFLLACAACGVIEHLMFQRHIRQQIQDIRDAEIDQEIVSREYDRRFGSR